MTSSTTRAFMAKKPFATASAFMAKTNQLLSTMARLRLLLVMFVALCVSTEVWGAEYTFSNIPTKGWSNTGGSQTINNLSWTYSSATHIGVTNSMIQVGSKNNPQTSNWTIQIPISSFGANIKVTKVAITAYTTATTATYDISVNGSSVKSGNLTTSSATYSSNTLNATTGSIVVTLKGSSNSKAMYLSNIAVTYETAAASCDKKVTVNKGTPSNGSFSISKTGTYETCDAPLVITLSNITPSAGYQFGAITQTGIGTGVTIDQANKTVTYAKNTSGASTINVTFEQKQSATITLSEAGVETGVAGKYVGDSYTLPSTTSQSCGDLEFVGWSTVEINNSASKPASNYYAKGASVTLAANQTFYAVFATAEGSQNVFKRMQTLDDLNNASKIAIINAYSSSAYILNTSLTAAAEAPEESSSKITVTEGQYWTLEKSNSYWKFKNADNKYLTTNTIPTSSSKSGSVQLATSGNNEWVIAENTYTNNGTPVFTIYNATSTTAGLEYNNGWILYYSTNFNTSWFTLKLYIPDVSYSDYTTQCSNKPSRYLTPKYRGDSGGT